MGRDRRREGDGRARCGVIERAEQHPSGRLFGMVVPGADRHLHGRPAARTATPEARQRGVPWQIHAAQSVVEFHEITRRHGMTPIEWLDSLRLLGRRRIIGHGIFLDDHPSTQLARRATTSKP